MLPFCLKEAKKSRTSKTSWERKAWMDHLQVYREMSSPIAAKELLKVSLGCKLVVRRIIINFACTRVRAPATRLRQTWEAKCLQNVLDVISLVSRINFTKTTSFNLVLFTKVDDVKTVKEKMKEGGAADTQTAHFYVQNLPQWRESTGNNYSYFFLSARAGGILQILRSDWFRERAVFSHPARSQRAVSDAWWVVDYITYFVAIFHKLLRYLSWKPLTFLWQVLISTWTRTIYELLARKVFSWWRILP